MIQNYQDGMALCRVFGAPDLFVTFTCNPKWDEIADALLMEPGQTYADRPDLVTRVFKMKVNSYVKGVRKGIENIWSHQCMYAFSLSLCDFNILLHNQINYDIIFRFMDTSASLIIHNLLFSPLCRSICC